MKKGIITALLLIAGALFLTPIANISFAKDATENTELVEVGVISNKVQASDEAKEETTQLEEVNNQVKEEQNISKEEVKKEEYTIKEEIKDEDVTESLDEVVNDDKGMTKEDAQVILNKYIREVEQADFTYTYQGDENTFKVIKEKGIRGYVFLPNIETDMAYLVDKDNENIYFFHPSGYFELLQ